MAFDPGALKAKLGDLVSGLLARLPFASKKDRAKRPAKAGGASESAARERPRLKDIVALVFRNRIVLVSTVSILVLFLLIAITALVTGAPPKALSEGVAPTPEGEALVSEWLLPDDESLLPVIELEREPKSVYTSVDVARFATDPAGVDSSALSARNDAAAAALFGTVP